MKKLLLCFVLIYYFEIIKLFYFIIILSLFTKHLDYISGRGEGVQV